MTKSEAIELAQGIARKEEWPWLEPVTVVLRREWIFRTVSLDYPYKRP
jgi:hypothetical protein